MCLTVSDIIHEPVQNTAGFYYRHAITADKPILVTKFLECRRFNGGWMTPFQYHQVRFHNGVTTIKPKAGHPFDERVSAWRTFRGDWCPTDISYGIHSFYHKDQVEREMRHYHKETWDISPFKAIIPKGAKYYIGTDGDTVSNSLVVFENDKAYERYITRHGEPITIDTYYEE